MQTCRGTGRSRDGTAKPPGILGLGGIPRRVITAIKRFSSKVNTIIDLLLLKVVTVIKKMFGIKPAAGGAAAPSKGKDKGKAKANGKGRKGGKKSYKGKGGKKKKGDKGKGKKKKKKGDKDGGLTAKDLKKHKSYVRAIDTALKKKPKEQPEDFEDFHKMEEKKAHGLIAKYNAKLTKKVNGKPIKTFIKFKPVSSDAQDNDVDYEIEIKPNTTSLKGSAKFENPPFPASPKISPNFGSNQFHHVRIEDWHKSNHAAGSPASKYGGNLHGADTILRTLGVRSKWVAFHVLNENIGGKAVDSNLIPAHAEDNKSYLHEFETRLKNLHKKDHVIWFEAGATYRESSPFVEKYWAKGGKMKYKNGKWALGKRDVITWDVTVREPVVSILKINKMPHFKAVAKPMFKRIISNSDVWEKVIDVLEPRMPFSNKKEINDYIDSLPRLNAVIKKRYKNQIDSARLNFDRQ